MRPDKRLLASLLTLFAATVLGTPERANAGPTLYTGSIQLRLSSHYASYSYGIPFGSNISYPSLNNLPSSDSVSVSGSAPAAFWIINPNQMVLQTSISTSSVPTSWSASFVASSFSGGHATGSFLASGAPGPATSNPLASLPASQFGVSFSGAGSGFGGTMQLLGSSWVWLNAGSQSAGGHIWCSMCTVHSRPLSAIGGSFGGSAASSTYINGTASSPTFFEATVWGFPWTTGTVSAMAPAVTWPGGIQTPETLTAMGTDKRSSQGSGEIQLVTPFVVRQRVNQDFNYRAGIAIASLHFVPEPAALLQLAAGFSALAAVYASCHRSKRNGTDQR